jgi:hypothetical protein
VERIGDAQHWLSEEPPRLLGDTLCLRFRRRSAGPIGDDLEPLVVED